MRMRIISTVAVLTVAGFAAETPDAAGSNITRPPVLRGSEPTDSGILTLPAPPPAPPVSEPPQAPAVRTESTTPVPTAPPPTVPIDAPQDLRPASAPPSTAPLPSPPPLPKSPKAVHASSTTTNAPVPAARAVPKLFLPPDFERDSAIYCQKLIGEWAEADVYNLFGDPLRQRTAPNDGKKEDSGRILAFSDPTGRYREIELDFAPNTGLLRSVFVYPWQMTWQECRRLWDGEVSSARANKGRTFYSYVNRRLDVLVDPAGKVISFGLY